MNGRKGFQRLLCACGVEKPPYGRDAIGRQADAPGVFPDGLLVRREIDAVHLVTGYIAMEPPDLGTHFQQNSD